MTLLSIPRSANPSPRRPVRRLDPDEMRMDRQTFKDLEVFHAERSEPSLFDLLNYTRTVGGEKSLRAHEKAVVQGGAYPRCAGVAAIHQCTLCRFRYSW